MSDPMIRLAVDVDRDVYNKVTSKMHHGQISMLIRKMFDDLMIQLDDPSRKDCIINYLYREQPLVIGGFVDGKD